LTHHYIIAIISASRPREYVDMGRFSTRHLADAVVLQGMKSIRGRERAATALLIAYIAEADERKLFLAEACDSMVAYCERELGFTDAEARKRVHAGRWARRFPQSALVGDSGGGFSCDPHRACASTAACGGALHGAARVEPGDRGRTARVRSAPQPHDPVGASWRR